MIKERLNNLNEELRDIYLSLDRELPEDIEDLTILDIRQHYANLDILKSRVGKLLAEYKITEIEYANT